MSRLRAMLSLVVVELALGPLSAADHVEHAKLEVVFVEQQVLVLRVDVHQLFAHFLEQGERYGCVVDEGPALACSGQFAPDDAVVRVVVYVVLLEQRLQSVAGYVEVCLYEATVASALDDLRVGPLSEQQSDGAEYDALTGSRLAGEYRESRVELHVQLFDERIVLDI